MTNKFKAGDRVKHQCDEIDIGTFMRYLGQDLVEVSWDIDGIQSNYTENLYTVDYYDNKSVEQEAVMLLLSLGYTVSKVPQEPSVGK